MIQVAEGCEYTVMIASFIEQLASLDKFVLNIHMSNGTTPLVFTDEDAFMFYDDGFRVQSDNHTSYIFYDMLVGMEIIHNEVFP